MGHSLPSAVSYPVSLDEWRNELANLNESFGQCDGYWCYVRPGTYRIGEWTTPVPEPVEGTESDSDSVPWYLRGTEKSANIDLPGYWIAKYPITVQQYRQFINAGGYDNRQYWTDNGWERKEAYGRSQPHWWNEEDVNSDNNRPVIGMGWYEASAFAAFLNENLADALPVGYHVRLPTEAEWEVACAYDEAGQRHTYPWGEQAPTVDLADYGRDWSDGALPIGGRPAGAAACGAQDMVGSVWEWTTSDYDGYADESNLRVLDFTTSQWKVPLRGASWWSSSNVLLCAARGWASPSSTSTTLAFAWLCPLSLRTNVLYSAF